MEIEKLRAYKELVDNPMLSAQLKFKRITKAKLYNIFSRKRKLFHLVINKQVRKLEYVYSRDLTAHHMVLCTDKISQRRVKRIGSYYFNDRTSMYSAVFKEWSRKFKFKINLIITIRNMIKMAYPESVRGEKFTEYDVSIGGHKFRAKALPIPVIGETIEKE